MKDYYAVLGVTPQAEDIVVKAAYRALAQQYHPDRFSGSVEEATRRMAGINEAYSVLSDPDKRKAYDAEYKNSGGNEGDFDAGDQAADEGVQQLNQDWNVALEYYPDLVNLEATLAKTSKSLAFTFRLFMITEKKFKLRREVADALQSAFLKNYFGERPAILDFAKALISLGRKDAAKALNEAVRVLGDDVDQAMIIHRIKGRFGLSDNVQRNPSPKNNRDPNSPIHAGESNSRAQRLANAAAKPSATFTDVHNAIAEFNGSVTMIGDGCSIEVLGEEAAFETRSGAVEWFCNCFFPRLKFQ